MADQKVNDMKDILNSPWINRILLGIVIYFAHDLADANKDLKASIKAMETDVAVMKKEIQMLTDYQIDPKR